jgi:hypothetical protein
LVRDTGIEVGLPRFADMDVDQPIYAPNWS